MAEPDKRQMGDGADNYAEGAKQMANAAKQAGKETAKQAAAAGAEATANAAAATVQAGVEGGKAVAEVAAGTAAGGPWGAILSAAWALRHTLYKIFDLHLPLFPDYHHADCILAIHYSQQRIRIRWDDGRYGEPDNADGFL